MTWTAPGPNPAGSIHNTADFSANGGLVTHAVGNIMLVIATCHNPTSGNEWCTGFTSTAPNVTGWTQITPTHNDTNTQLAIDSSNDVWGGNIWAGTVSAVSTDSTLAPAFSGPDHPPFYTNFVALEVHSSVGSWFVDAWTFLNSNAGVTTWPSLTATGNDRLYLGYAWDSSSALAPGTGAGTPGYVYNANADQTNNGLAYNLNCAQGTVAGPTWSDPNECWGLMVLLAEGSPGGAGPVVIQAPRLPVAGPALPYPQAGSRILALPAASSSAGPAYATAAGTVAGGTGSWVNPANAEGPPDGSDATWTAP